MKKFISIVLALMMIFAFCACGSDNASNSVKIGLICLHNENSTYDRNFIDAFTAACEVKGVEGIIKTEIDESSDCMEAACDLADEGCSAIFADSFGHEGYIIEAAKEYPEVQFCHATGTRAHTEGLDNYHNAFAAIYEGRYCDGIAAGMKLNEMIENGDITEDEAIIGYVGAYQYAEVVSGYTSFFIGVRSVCPSAMMKVRFTGSWYDETLEKEAATNLINSGAVVISGHADSMGSPTACEEMNVPFVFYNGSIEEACPNTFIVSTRINWQPYFEYMIDCILNDEPIDTDWVGDFNTGSVVMTEVNENAATPGTAEAIEYAVAAFKEGTLDVFDVNNFTVAGEPMSYYLADVDTDLAYEHETEVIIDGIFEESYFRSAPYFDIAIDGIEILG